MPQSTLLNPQRLVLLALLFAFTGCGRIAFVSERYDNFTAYYNTFYNAERSYSEGVDALEQTDESIDRQVYISIFEAPGQSTNDPRFQAAIDKSADVLREHPDSKWIDDALLLIGKSYFYQQNYVGAEQKFREVIGMGSPLEDEARLWLARTLISAGAHDEAREHLLVSLNREDVSRRWEPSLRLALGELHVKRSDYDAAIDQLTTGLENVRDNRYRARAAFLLGQVYETVGRYEDAVDAYQRVQDAHPRYQLSYASLYSAARVQGLYVDADEAITMLRRMERDDKNYSNRFELAYLRGRIYQSQNYAGDARALYHEILYDSDGQISDIRGRIHYALAELYRDAYSDYQTAAAHFDTARTSLRLPAPDAGGSRAAQIRFAPEAIIDAEERARMFGSFADVRAQLAEMDSLLHLGSLDDEAFRAKILEIRRKLAAEMAEEERRAARLQAEQRFQDAAAAGGAVRDAGSSSAAATSSGGAGFLFHLDQVRVQEGRMNFINRWGERPLAPNWRRIDAIRSVASLPDSVGLLRGQRLTDVDPAVGESPLPPIDYSNVPRDSLSTAAMRARRAAARYELANVLFLSMNEPDSAAAWYRTVIEEDDEFPVAQRAFYALAEVHSSLGDSAAARRLYEQVLEDYPTSDFAGRVREQLGIRADVPSDTLAIAEEEYDEAYERWRRGSYQRAADVMVEIAASYPDLEVAPRALLAVGHIFLEWAERDSMNIFGPIPLTVSESTLERAGLLGLAAAQPDSSQQASPDEPIEGNTPQGEWSEGESPPIDPAGEAHPPDEPAAGQAPPVDSDEPRMLPEDAAQQDPPGRQDADSQNGPPVQPPKMADVLTPTEDQPDHSTDVSGEAAAAGRSSQDTTGSDPYDQIVLDDSLAHTDIQAPADSPADSLAGADRRALADSLVGADTLARADDRAAAQTLAGTPGRADSTAVGSDDEFRVKSDSISDASAAASVSGTIATETNIGDVYLTTIYSGVKQNYPSTAYAERADRLLDALREREAELKAAADSLAAASIAAADSAAGLAISDWSMADSLDTPIADESAGTEADADTEAADEIADSPPPGGDDAPISVADTTATVEIPDTSSAPARLADVPDAGTSTETPTDAAQLVPEEPAGTFDIPTGEDAIRGEGGINTELGGYTLVIGSDNKEATMQVLAKKYEAQGFRTDVIIERGDDETVYRAAVGHFASQRDAGVLMQKYGSQIKETVQLTAIGDIQ